MSEQTTHVYTSRSSDASCAAMAILLGMLSGCFARKPPPSPPARVDLVHAECELSRAVELAARDTDASVRRAALSLLGTRGPDSSIDVVIDALADDDPQVRSAAIEALYSLEDRDGPGAPRVRRGLLQALDDSSWFNRELALNGLTNFDELSSDERESISVLLDDSSDSVQTFAVYALGHVETDSHLEAHAAMLIRHDSG
jgi:HEAT repeat protein